MHNQITFFLENLAPSSYFDILNEISLLENVMSRIELKLHSLNKTFLNRPVSEFIDELIMHIDKQFGADQ